MSVNTMTNAAIARRTDAGGRGRPPQTINEIAAAGEGAEPGETQNSITAALAVIVTYIPTEVLTLYVAVLAALSPPSGNADVVRRTFVVFLVSTPIIVWMTYAAKVKAAAKPLPVHPAQWPIWEMTAALVAFVAWAASLPGAPFLADLRLPSALGAVIVLVTAALLGLLAPLFQRTIQAA